MQFEQKIHLREFKEYVDGNLLIVLLYTMLIACVGQHTMHNIHIMHEQK